MSTLPEGLYIKLDSRLDAATAEIAALKGDLKKAETKSLMQRLTPITAIGAFLISALTATFTYYDRFVVGPVEDARATMDKLSEINLTLSRAMLEGPQQLQATMGSLAPQRTGALQRALDHFEVRPDVLTVTDHLLIGNELVAFGETAMAARVADSAIARAQGGLAEASAKLLKASALTMPSPVQDLAQARGLLETAVDQVKLDGSVPANGVLMDLQAGRIVLELMAGECEDAQRLVAEFVQDLEDRQIPLIVRKHARETMAAMKANVPGTCQLDLSQM